MIYKGALVACAILMLLAQSQAMSLVSSHQSASRGQLQKRSSWHWWWSWSSNTSGSDSSNDDSYGSGKTTPNSGVPQGQGQHPVKPPSNSGSYSPGGHPTPAYNGPKIPTNASEIHQWLDSHNRFRAQYSAGPLKWSETLVAASKRLTDKCIWQHTQNNEYGENMSAGQQSITEVVTGWVTGPDEKGSYTGGSTEPSHFTQVVWVATSEVGCYHTICQDVRGANLPQSPVTFWGCNYNPPGNVIGQIAQNVKAAPGGRPL